MASSRETWTVHASGRDAVMGFMPTYFPGTSNLAEARRVSVGIGHQANDTDFSLMEGRTAKVSGTAVDSHGRPLAGRTVGLTQTFRNASGGGDNFSVASGPVLPDGTFIIKNVPPGEYKLQARRPSSEPGGQDEAAAQMVSVDGTDVDHVALITSRGWSIAGKITAENGAPPDVSTNRVRLTATVPDATNPRGGPPGGRSRINDDWSFSVSDLFGPGKLDVNLPDGWAVKTVMHDGRDMTNTPFETKNGQDLSGVDVILTNRVTSVSGQLTDDKGAAVTDGTVMVFAADPRKWAESSRSVRAARPDRQGAWQIRGLPAGEYLAIAIDYVQEGAWNDPEYLDSLRRGAQTVTLAEGAEQTVPLKLATSK
jgi:hypothetical protein